MKFKIHVFIMCIIGGITLMVVKIDVFNVQAQSGLQLQLPFEGNYRLNSFLDHETPFVRANNPIVMFNGETYNNCPASSDQWTTQGPYCYDGHEGIDWAMPENTPVLVSASGIVTEVQPVDGGGYGIYVKIDHGNSYITQYAHLITVSVQLHDVVNTGDLIGLSGNTGSSSGPHLHFQVEHNGFVTDPFGWQGAGSDPLINYSGETAVCLWANKWCNETIVEDGDVNFDSSVVKFTEFGGEWSSTNWRSQGNSWTMKYIANGDGSSSGYWIPYLNPPGVYEVFVFIPNVFTNTATVTYTIHDKDTEHLQLVNQAAYLNQWVNLGTYNFESGGNNYIKLTNQTTTTANTQYVVFDTIKFRSYFVYLPLTLKNYYPDTYEPNNDFASAFEIVSDQEYLSYINPTTDKDWFKSSIIVPVNKERVINVNLSSIPAGTDYDLALYDENNNLLAESINNSNNNESISQLVSESGFYRIKIYSVLGFSQTDSYSLSLSIGEPAIPKTKS